MPLFKEKPKASKPAPPKPKVEAKAKEPEKEAPPAKVKPRGLTPSVFGPGQVNLRGSSFSVSTGKLNTKGMNFVRK